MKHVHLGLAPLLVSILACTAHDTSIGEEASGVTSATGTLRVAVSSEATAIDPHYSFLDPNITVGHMIFESLYAYGPNKELLPLLATRGAPTADPKVWSFTLKRGVTFHSGKPFTKADVLCNMRRILSYELHAGGYKGQLANVDLAQTEALNAASSDPLDLRVATKAASPFLPSDLANVFLTSCASTEKASAIETEDATRDKKETSAKILAAFASGELADGTGPYAFASFSPLSAGADKAKAVVTVNPRYHGTTGQFAKIEVVPIPDDEARVDRLLAGDVQLVNAVPMARMAEVEAAGFDVTKARGLRVMHMWMYQKDDGRQANAVHVPLKDDAGNAYTSPFVSKAFRRAFALAVDRSKLVDVVDGAGVTTTQMLPAGRVGHIGGRPDDVFDRAEARKAFAAASSEAGLGFLAGKKLTLTVHGPNDRYPGDGKVLEALAAMWTDAFGSFTVDGVAYSLTVKAAAEPKAAYFANAKNYLTGFLGGGIANGHASSALALYLVPGSSLNYGNYANDDVTSKYKAGSSDVQASSSDATLTRALTTALDDFGVLPLYNPLVSWASAKSVAYTPRVDDLTMPHHVTKR